MDVMSAESPVKASMRQVNFWPDPEVREWLDTYVPQQGMTIRGYLLRLVRQDMAKVQDGEVSPTPKASGRKDVARSRSGNPNASLTRQLVPIEEMAVA